MNCDSYATVSFLDELIDESTPLKNENHHLQNKLYLSPIGKRLSLNNTLEDIDSAYYSRLKGNSPSISSFRSPSIRSPSVFSSKFLPILDSFDSIENNDILSKIFKRNIFHVINIILNKLGVADYIKLYMVCKNWNQIVNDNLRHNFKRRMELKLAKEDYISKKENVWLKFEMPILHNHVAEILPNDEERMDENMRHIEIKKYKTPELNSSNNYRSFSICSRVNRKNLKRL